MLTAISQRLSVREMSVRGEGPVGAGAEGCGRCAVERSRSSLALGCASMLAAAMRCCSAALAAGCRYDEDEVLAYTAAVACTLAPRPHSEPQVGLRVGTVKPAGARLSPDDAAVAEEAVGAPLGAVRSPERSGRRELDTFGRAGPTRLSEADERPGAAGTVVADRPLWLEGGIYLSQVDSRHGRSTGGRARERIGSVGRGRPGRGLTIRLR